MKDAWSRLEEIAQALPTDSWMLVGGLMVHLHAQKAGVRHVRPTDDADLVIELAATSYSAAARTISGLGYQLQMPLDPHSPVHRFTMDGAHVDLMAAEGTRARFAGRDVVTAPGSRSALLRTVSIRLDSGSMIRVPDLPSALSLKGAAYSLPGSNRVRHLQDGVSLLACVDDKLDLSKSMRAHVNTLIRGLDHVDAWGYADTATRRRAVRALRAFRPDWEVPTFVLQRRA